MVSVRDQYEAFPFPSRDPQDERHRLISGSPSHPVKIDHRLWGGGRDWSRPFRVLVAGGGTGDGMIQLTQVMADAGRPAEITYVDLSRAAREIAEARAEIRGLTGIRFVTGSLLHAAALGRFDYIDCFGVLHHLADPLAGLRALRAALAPGGGLGFMIYAPYGRSGIYPLQDAFATLFAGLSPEDRLAAARAALGAVPEKLDRTTCMALAEALRGTVKIHVGYARAADDPAPVAGSARVPHLAALSAVAPADAVRHGALWLTLDAVTAPVELPPETAAIIARIDGRCDPHDIAREAGFPAPTFQALWERIEAELEPWGALLYSGLLAK